jgi:hypothetical protein
MVYQDHLTKFCNIKPLTSKKASEVAFNLIDVFTIFGAPHILQSDNGREFTALVISELKLMWPELVIVHGKPRHPQSQGSIERSNGDIYDMLTAWMRDNESNKWSVGIKFVQLQKNSALNKGIETTISVREAASNQSLSGGQGFLKCSCKSKCSSNRCKCKKNVKLCNSLCHNSGSCDNK